MSEEVKNPIEAPVAEAQATTTKSKAKKGKRIVQSGQVHIQATFNNTIISVTDNKGEILTSSSAGANGFRGSKKGTAYAAQIAAEKMGVSVNSMVNLGTFLVPIIVCVFCLVGFAFSFSNSIIIKSRG